MLNLLWDEISALSEHGASVRLEDSKTGPRAIWFGPEAARPAAAIAPHEWAGNACSPTTSRPGGSMNSGAAIALANRLPVDH